MFVTKPNFSPEKMVIPKHTFLNLTMMHITSIENIHFNLAAMAS